ncbi:MAG: glycosyltransferase family 39 protein [Flavobacteriia bacterium]|nr:glycosyltransferase family 39 protein [Flavobacteriia bacterium]
MNSFFRIIRKYDNVVFIFSFFVSIIIRFIFLDKYHQYDVSTFLEWSHFLSPIRNVYLTDCYCNYPILGLLFSSGIIRLFSFQIEPFLYFLSLIDALNVLLVYQIFKKSEVQNAKIYTFFISISISTWIIGGVWGQIDNIGQTFIYLILLLIILLTKKISERNRYIYLLMIGILLCCALYIKQLLIFSVFPFFIFSVLLIYFHTNFLKLKKWKYFAIFICGLFIPFIFFEFFLYIPEKYFFSHLEKIFLEGSDHINIIADNGFNLWTLFSNHQFDDSSKNWIFFLSPKTIGISLFSLFSLWLITKCFLFLKKFKKINYVQIIFFILFFNLLFNVVLTGTHERYIYHFYPLYLIFIFSLQNIKKENLINIEKILAFVLATIYGVFVYLILRKHLNSFYFHHFLAILHLLLFFRMFFYGQKLFSLKENPFKSEV